MIATELSHGVDYSHGPSCRRASRGQQRTFCRQPNSTASAMRSVPHVRAHRRDALREFSVKTSLPDRSLPVG